TSANQYADGTNARAWINTISRNLALNVYKKRKKECLVDFEEKDCFGESKEMLARDETGIIAMTLKVLDKNESDIVLMHTIGEIKLVEIAKMMNKSSATVRWQYNNALNKLRKFVEEQQ
ncbi:MAG: RNA polymerase sigma factor, partial [Clostridia bacterium]